MTYYVLNMGGGCDPTLPCFSLCYQRKAGVSHITKQHIDFLSSKVIQTSDNVISIHVNGGTSEELVHYTYLTLVHGKNRWAITTSIYDIDKAMRIRNTIKAPPLFHIGSWIIGSDTDIQNNEGNLTGYTYVLPSNISRDVAIDSVRERIGKQCHIRKKDTVIYLLAEHGGKGCTSEFPDSYLDVYNSVAEFLIGKFNNGTITGLNLDGCISKMFCQASEHNFNVINIIPLPDGKLSVGGCPWNGEIVCKSQHRRIYELG